jgi:hypothetical protein
VLLYCPLCCSDGCILEEVDARAQPVVIIITSQKSLLEDVGCFSSAGAMVSIDDRSVVHNCMISLCPKYILRKSFGVYWVASPTPSISVRLPPVGYANAKNISNGFIWTHNLSNLTQSESVRPQNLETLSR